MRPPYQTQADSGSDVIQTTVVIDGISFRIFVPKPSPGSAGATAEYEVVILGRCANEKCQRVIPSTRTFCDNNNACKNAFHNLDRKFRDLMADPKYLPFK